MINSPPGSYSGGGGSRRIRYSRSPSDNAPPLKRSKPSSSNDPYDRNYGSGSEQSRIYTSICVKNINPKISDSEIRDLCNKKFSKYGSNSIKIYHKHQERVAFVNFINCEDARKARHAKTGLVWENMQVLLEPVYYRKTVPAEQPIKPESSRERSPKTRRHRRPTPPSPLPSPPPASSHHRSLSRRQHTKSPSRSSRPARRQYSPFIPLPPDLANYKKNISSRQREHSSPSPPPPPPPVRRHHHKKQHSPTPNKHRTSSPSSPNRNNLDNESNIQNEPTRTLLIENLERNVTESKLEGIFGRYGTIKKIDLRKSSSKGVYASIQYENVDMAYEARRAMDGQSIGKANCKINYGKIVPTKHLWVGNIPEDIQRRDLEHVFSRYGQIKTFDYSTGDPTAIITYRDIEDAIKARKKLNGTIKIVDGRVVRSESDTSPSSHRGFRIDYLDRPTSRRFVVVRPHKKSLNKRESRSSSRSKSRNRSPASSTHDRTRSPSNDVNNDEQTKDNLTENLKTETHSRSPTPSSILNTIKQRRSTDRSESSPLTNLAPIAGRTFYGSLGSYLSPDDTANVTNLDELMILCEQLNLSATKSNTALATVYPVQFILKSHAYDARMHFLAGSPSLASILLGQPGDLIAAKTELKITQRLRLDQQKLEDLERKLRSSVTNALAITENSTRKNINGHSSNSSTLINNRKQLTLANQTKFAILIATPKINTSNESLNSIEQQMSSGKIKNEITSPSHSDEYDKRNLEIKKEQMNNDDTDNEDDLSLSCLISYLIEKEAAGVISMPFHPTYHSDYEHSSKQETAVIHIFPPCQFSKKVLKIICPSIHFSNITTTINDEHLMVVIVHND
ncbi:unnamed protein product [Rotaria sp. Silwood1]|nr:unnamed protein product [Rotaria sp. Silwood1]CAF4577572.1 unnamed protein product [Rotaria sp. Silwood1]CAF4635256.1 unnamed protein product [Rotaria sp. Silwood1]